MLDQNTDRMWYVIGAVVLGAAILLLLNSTAPEVFASVGGTMTDVTDRATYEIKAKFGGFENLFSSDHPMYNTLTGDDFITYEHNDKNGITLTNTSDAPTRAKIRLPDIIPSGSLYAVSFDMRSDKTGTSGLYVDISDINEYPGRVDNIPQNITTDWTPYTVTVRHDGNFESDKEEEMTKMNFVDFNVMVDGHTSVELRDVVVSRVVE